MLKTRIIPCLLFKDRTIVKSVQFGEFRMVGDPTTCARVFNTRKADELIFLDIMASRCNKEPNFKVIDDISNECFMPLSIGGGINNMAHADKMFQIGADKIIVNTALIANPDFIRQCSKKYGSQALIASIDVKKEDNGYSPYIYGGQKKTGLSLAQMIKLAEKLNVGEIMVNSIDRDGTCKGYDIDMIKLASKETSMPVIATGGAGKLDDFVLAIKEGEADALCAASIFFFVGESIITIKEHMSKNRINVRKT